MALRVTAQYIDVAVSGIVGGSIRVEAQHVEVGGTLDLGTTIRVEAQHVEVGGDNTITADLRMMGHYVEVLRANDHRSLTSILGTIASGLATETLQLGAGSQGPSFFEPENTGKVGTRSSLPGGHLQPGKSALSDALNDTGELGIDDAVLNQHFILAFGADALAPGERFGDGDNTITLTDQASVIVKIVVPATTDINIDGTWGNAATSSIKSLSASNTLALGSIGDHQLRFVDAESDLSILQVTAQPGLFTPKAVSTIVLVGAEADSGIQQGLASSSITLTQATDKFTSILSVNAENIVSGLAQIAENNSVEVSAESTLALTVDIDVAKPSELDANNTIPTTDQADVVFNVFGRVALSDLNISLTNPNGGIADTNIQNLEAVTPDPLSDDANAFPGFMNAWSVVARLADTFDLTATSDIVLTQLLPQPTGKRSVDAVSILSLIDFADTIDTSRTVEQTIILTQEATFELVLRAVSQLSMSVTTEEGFVNLFAEDIIVFDDIARSTPYERASENTITLTHSAKSSIKELAVENTIIVDQDINVLRPYYVEALSLVVGFFEDEFLPPLGPIIPGAPFGLEVEATQSLDAIRHPSTLIPVANTATPVHIHFDAIDLLADSTVGLTQLANLSSVAAAETIIDSLQDSAIVTKNSELAINLIALVDQVAVNINRANTLAENIIGIKHAVGFTLEVDTTKCDYTPFISARDNQLTPPRPELPEVREPTLPGVRFRLAYPAFDTGTTIDFLDLRAPEFGNRERIDATRINRESLGGTLVIFADPIWPEIHSLEMSFAALEEQQARGLLDFIERWVGQEIGIYDYEGRIWKGVITNPDEAVTHDGRQSFSASLQIEAERVYQLNRVARSNLRIGDVTEQDEALAFSTITTSQDADYTHVSVAPGDSPIDISDSAGYTKVPVNTGFTGIPLSAFSTRNSFFYEDAASSISLIDTAADLDFDDFGNLIHNWDAENTTGVSSGNPVSSWSDLGSNNITLNATVAKEPTARDNILNGRRVIEFRHGSVPQRLLSASSLSLFDVTNKVGTIFIVTIIREALSGGNETILGNNTDKIMLGGTTSSQRPVALLSAESTDGLETPQSVLANDSTQLFMVRRNNNTVTFRRNKSDEDGTTYSTNPTPGNEDLYFGGFSGAGNSVDQDIAQVLIYDDALSNEDILTIEGLLTAKWGV